MREREKQGESPAFLLIIAVVHEAFVTITHIFEQIGERAANYADRCADVLLYTGFALRSLIYHG